MIPMRPILVSGALLSLLFLAFPQIDLWASGLLFESGRGFVLNGNPYFDFIHDEVGYLAWAILLGSLLIFLASFWPGGPGWLQAKRLPVVYVVLALVLGPGLVANSLLKEHWGRARPADVQDFGGENRFTPAWVMSDQCGRNCSFVCGDSSLGFGLAVVAFVSRRPRFWLTLGLTTGAALGLMRMGQGGHFLSDVIFSFYVVYLSAWLLHRLMRRWRLLHEAATS